MLGLIILQIILCGALIAFANSPWFCKYFNLRMRENCLVGYTSSQHHDPALLLEALKYSAASKGRNSEDLSLLEELGIASASDNSHIMNSALARIHSFEKNGSAVAEVAKKKEARVRMYRVLALLKDGEVDAARNELKKVLELLRQMSQQTEKLFLLTRYFALASAVAKTDGDSRLANEYDADLKNLNVPKLADAIYSKYNLPGANVDCSSDYRALYYLSQLRRSSDLKAKQEAIDHLVEILDRDDVSRSSKAPVLLELAYHAAGVQDKKLGSRLVQKWLELKSSTPATSIEEINTMVPLLQLGLILNDPSTGITILEYYMSSLETKKLPHYAYGNFFPYFDVQCLQLKVFPNNPEYRDRLGKIIERAELFARENNETAASIQLVKLDILLDDGKIAEAEKLLTKNVLLNKEYKSINSKPERFLILTSIVNRLAEGLQAKFGSKSRSKFLDFVLNSDKIPIAIKASTAIKRAELEHIYDGKSSGQTNEILAKYINLKGLDSASHYDLEDTLLRFYCWSGDFNNGAHFYARLKNELKNRPDVLLSHCHSALSWLRAFPSFTPEWHALCVEKRFPDAIFRDGFALLPNSKDESYKGSYILWFAQYELCRGDKNECTRLCDSLLSKPENKKYSFYFPAQVLRSQLVDDAEIPKGKIHCVKGTRDELACLWSLLYTADYKKASARVKTLCEQQIEE